MTKTSTRQVRSLTRELFKTKNNTAKTVRNLSAKTEEASKSKQQVSVMISWNKTLSKNVRTFYDMFLKQQAIIRQQQAKIRDLNFQSKPVQSTENENCAKTMIALSQQLCCDCLGTRTIFKTKKHIRFSVECKACKIS